MPEYAYAILAAGMIGWGLPFVLMMRRSGQKPTTVDRRARWGLLFEAVAYLLAWQSASWLRSPAWWRVALSTAFFAFAVALAWLARWALGRHWRVDAGLNADHELVQSGVYRLVRHPIYTSMLCLLFGMGFMVTPFPILCVSTALFMIGTEIRVRSEDRLLASRFGDRFFQYQRAVPAYVPFWKPRREAVAVERGAGFAYYGPHRGLRLRRRVAAGVIVGVDPEIGVLHVRTLRRVGESFVTDIGHLPIERVDFERSLHSFAEPAPRAVEDAAPTVASWRQRHAGGEVKAFSVPLWKAEEMSWSAIPESEKAQGREGLYVAYAFPLRVGEGGSGGVEVGLHRHAVAAQ